MPLTFTLAFRNLFHDRLRLIATVIGIVFSIVLVMVQMGLYLGFGRMVTTMIDNASADLWIMPKGTKCFEDPSLLDARQRNRALSVPGVAEAIPVVIGFADWRTPERARRRRSSWLVRTCARAGLQPWNLVEGRVESLSTPNAVAVDKTYFDRLGISGLGARAEIRQQTVRVAAVTEGIRSFTTTPYVFMDVDRARSYTGTPSSKATYFLVNVDRGCRRRDRAQQSPLHARRRRGAHAARIPRTEPLVLAVRHRRGRSAVRRRACSASSSAP